MGTILGGLILGRVGVLGQEGGWAVVSLFTNRSLSIRATCCLLLCQSGLDRRSQNLCSQRETNVWPLALFLAWAAALGWGGGTQKSLETQRLRLPRVQ